MGTAPEHPSNRRLAEPEQRPSGEAQGSTDHDSRRVGTPLGGVLGMIGKVATIIRHYRLRSLPIAARFVNYWIAREVLGCETLKARILGASITVPLRVNGIGRALYVYREREPDHKWMLEKVLRPDDVILDLGANIGYYAILQATILGHRCRIHCVEPDPRNLDYLSRNIHENMLSSRVTVEACAIGDREEIGTLVAAERTNLSKLDCPAFRIDPGARISVQVRDFAQYLQAIDAPVSLVRMDIEGGELAVFRSMLRARQRGSNFKMPRRIIFETHDYGASCDDMHATMLGLFEVGYRVEFMSSYDELSDRPVFREMNYRPILMISDVGLRRGIYGQVAAADAAFLISRWRGTRTVCLVH